MKSLTLMAPQLKTIVDVDIGPKTIAAYDALLRDAKTVVWNGPMGVFEVPAFAEGTNAIV